MWLGKPSVNVTLPAIGAVAALLAAVLAPSRAHACSCMMSPPPAEARDAAAAVFEGRVVAIEQTGEPGATALRVRLRVVRTWKAANSEEITVSTAGDSAACGYTFEADQSYLIYAYQPEGGGDLGVSLCSRTARIEQAGEDLAVLGSGVTPVDPNGPVDIDTPPPATQSRTPPPASGGCASCTVGAPGAALDPLVVGLALGLALALLGLLRRRRSTDRSAE